MLATRIMTTSISMKCEVPLHLIFLSVGYLRGIVDSCFNLRFSCVQVIKDNVAGFVVGYPVSIAGLRGLQTVKVDEFVSRLRNTEAFEGLVYSWEDERFTSQVVASMLKDYDINPLILKHISDKFSAVNILQVWHDWLMS
ncbi:hypothetical protein KP509_1Z322000 [Ceratopteris richardii]|nr:hypothetical protein KP509_1Z322000 [Ceratopteris richardii]